MEPRDYLKAIGTRWKVVLVVVVVTLVAAWVTTPTAPQAQPASRSYTATATLLQEPGATQSLPFVALFVRRGEIPKAVAKEIGWTADPAILAAQVRVEPDDAIGALEITVGGQDGAQAAKTANAFADQTRAYFLRRDLDAVDARISELRGQVRQASDELADAQRSAAPGDLAAQQRIQSLATRYGSLYSSLLEASSQRANTRPALEVLEKATPIPIDEGVFIAPPSSRTARMGIALVLGVLIGCGLALAVARVDTRLRRRSDVQQAFDLPVLAEVPRQSRTMARARRVAAVEEPGGAVADGFRSLRSALLLLTPSRLLPGARDAGPTSGDGRPKVVLVTSARTGEGKTTTVVNLAACLAETGKRVLVVDCDVRDPDAHRFLDVPPGIGISDMVLEGERQLVRATSITRVSLIQAGTGPYGHIAIPLTLPQVIAKVRDSYDVILVDSPPVLAGNEAMDAMVVADAVLLVCRAGRTTTEQAQRTRELVARMGVPVYGVALVGTTEAVLPLRRAGRSERSSATRVSTVPDLLRRREPGEPVPADQDVAPVPGPRPVPGPADETAAPSADPLSHPPTPPQQPAPSPTGPRAAEPAPPHKALARYTASPPSQVNDQAPAPDGANGRKPAGQGGPRRQPPRSSRKTSRRSR